VILDVVRTNTLSLLAIEIEPIRIDLIVAIVGVVSCEAISTEIKDYIDTLSNELAITGRLISKEKI
jgi:hypothetical protein